MSFRRCVSRYVPRTDPRKRVACGAAVLLLAGCGGGAHAEQVVRGTGYRFSAPADWSVARSARQVRVSDALDLVSVTRYPLVRRFRPSLWAEVVQELDRAAAGVARQQNGRVTESRTALLSGRRARIYELDYEHDGKKLAERIAFLLRGHTEYYLLCRYERGRDTQACDRLLATFTLA